MKVTQKKAEEGKVLLQATATAAEVDAALDAAQVAFAQAMGVRPEPNKSVAQLAQEQLGVKDLDSIVESAAMEALVPLALDVKDIVPLYAPTPEPDGKLTRGKEFKFAIDVALKPDYELTSYDPVSFKAVKFEVMDADVDAELARLADRYKAYVPYTDAPADKQLEAGDSVKITIEAYEDGKKMEQLSTLGRTYVAGMGYMPEGFENQVLGMKAGETKEFTFEGPSFDENYNPTTTTVEAKVTIVGFEKEETPELNDEWVQKNMPMYKGIAELRADIRKQLEQAGRKQYETYLMQLATEELAKRFEGKIPDEAYESTRDRLVSMYRQSLQQQGKSFEEFVAENGGEQQFGMFLMIETRQMLVNGFVLDSIYRHENMELTEEDMLEACQSLNPQADPKATRAQMEEAGRGFALRESAERLKANKWLVETANIEYVEQ